MVFIPKKNLNKALDLKYKMSEKSEVLKMIVGIFRPFFGFVKKNVKSPEIARVFLSALGYFLMVYGFFYGVLAWILEIFLDLSTDLPSSSKFLKVFAKFVSTFTSLMFFTITIQATHGENSVSIFIMISSLHTLLFLSILSESSKCMHTSLNHWKLQEFKFLLLLTSSTTLQVGGFSLFQLSTATLGTYVIWEFLNTKPFQTTGKDLYKYLPIIIMNTSLYFWLKSSLITDYAIPVLFSHNLVVSVTLIKFKTLKAFKVKMTWVQPEYLIELLLIGQENFYRILPTDFAFIIFALLILVRYLTLILIILKELKSYAKA